MRHLLPGTVYLRTLHYVILNMVLNTNLRLSYSDSPPDWYLLQHLCSLGIYGAL